MTAIFTRRANIASVVEAERNSRSANSFSLSRAIGIVAAGGDKFDGYEGEVMSELARAIGPSAVSNRVTTRSLWANNSGTSCAVNGETLNSLPGICAISRNCPVSGI